jgi:hypothetical protein
MYKLRLKHTIPAIVLLAIIMLLVVQSSHVSAQTNYGDTNVEVYPVTLTSQQVVALTKITVTQPTTFQSVSLYLQYYGSDGSQCIKFGIYADNNGTKSGPIGEQLVAATTNGYCIPVVNSNGAWQTWNLLPSDYLTINSPGVYWLCTLALQSYGTIFHFSYTGAYGGQGYYNYGYSSYSFAASYTLGFPPSVGFGTNTQYQNFPNYDRYLTNTTAPYSFYMSTSYQPNSNVQPVTNP